MERRPFSCSASVDRTELDQKSHSPANQAKASLRARSRSAGVSNEGLARNPPDGDPARNELAGESCMAERLGNVGTPVEPVPLLLARPMRPRRADLVHARNGAHYY